MDINFSGKRALVTGAAQGIGKETAIKLLQCKAKVVALDRDLASLTTLKAEYPEIEIVQADVSDWNGVQKVVEGLGPIDLLVNNAGIIERETFGSVTEDSLTRILDINVKSLFNISQVVSNGMKSRGVPGSIVNLASVTSRLPFAGFGAYCVSKAGVVMLTQIMAMELGPHKIRVNAVSPTVVTPTAMGRTVMGMIGEDESNISTLMSRHTLGRLAEPINVANAIAFLLSDQASLIHGINMPVDAGAMAS